jgi:transaldolase
LSPVGYAQLIFSLSRYEAVIDAYLDGLEASGLSDLSKVTSVASFFVSRVDTLVDKKLEKIGSPEALDLRGKVSRFYYFSSCGGTKNPKR